MSSELTILALYGIIVIVTLVLQVLAAMGQVGMAMLASPRDGMPPLTGVPGRLQRALDNSVTAMALFAPAILILHAQGGFTAKTLLTAQIFLIARILYVIAYAGGIPWLRTLIWACGFVATLVLYLMAL